MGSGRAHLGRQFIRAGLVDEIEIRHEHIQLEAITVESTPPATHMRFRVVK